MGHAAAAGRVSAVQPSRAEEKSLKETAAMDPVSLAAAAGLRDSAASAVHQNPSQKYSTVLIPVHEIQ